MQRNDKRIKAPKDIPTLNQGEIENVKIKHRKTLNRWYKIYLLTTLSVVILTLLFLAVSINNSPSIDIPLADRIASFFISSELRTLSGTNKHFDDNEGGDTNNGDNIHNSPDATDTIILPPDTPDQNEDSITPPDNLPEPPVSSLYDFDYSKVPDGETPIVPMDLSLSSNGSTYIHNSTGYSPDTKYLLASDFKRDDNTMYISNLTSPLVLIVHTHGTESYSPDGAISYLDNGSEIARSENTSENVVAVGAVMAEILEKNGIPTIHCTIMHDQIQYKDSYARAEATIKQYLKKYPSIKLVIDIHRDSVVKSSGELVRPVTSINSLPTAQVMCVVGSDWGGQSCPSWQNNLSLALKLRDALNKKYHNLCRPTYLRPSTYNQELAPYSLLLEIGASGNSIEEAKRAVALVSEELVPLIKKL